MGDVRSLYDDIGITIAKVSGSELVAAECPSCDRDKFYISAESGLAHCKHCTYGEGLNLYKIVRQQLGEHQATVDRMQQHGFSMDQGSPASPPSSPRTPAAGPVQFKEDVKWEYPAPPMKEIAALGEVRGRTFAGKWGVNSMALRCLSLGFHSDFKKRDIVLIPGMDPSAPEGMTRPVSYIRIRLDGLPMKEETNQKGEVKRTDKMLSLRSKVGLIGANRMMKDNPQMILYSEGWRDLVSAWDNLRAGGLDRNFGVCASSHGAKSFPVGCLPLFDGKDVYMAMDADGTGQSATEKICLILSGTARNIYVCDLGFEIVETNGKDLNDYCMQDGMNPTRFRAELLGDAKLWKPQIEGLDHLIPDAYPQTIAQRIYEYFVKNGLDYRWYNGTWYLCKNNKYQPMLEDRLRIEVGRLITPMKVSKERGLRDFPVTDSVVMNSLHRFSELTTVTIDGHDDDVMPFWVQPKADQPPSDSIIATKSKLINISGVAVHEREHDSNLFTINYLDYNYNSGAECPLWMRFIRNVFCKEEYTSDEPFDHNQVKLLQEFMGLYLVNDTKYQKILGIIGSPRAGKGVVSDIIQALVGPKNYVATSLRLLSGDFGLESLVGKSVAIIRDVRTPPGNIAHVIEILNNISGEDPVTVRRMYRQHAENIKFNCRLIMVGNELQNLYDPSAAIARRFKFVRFSKSYLGREDVHLKGRILQEIPGIFNWCLQGLRRLRLQGFTHSDVSESITSDFSETVSPVLGFISEECIVEKNHTVTLKALYERYNQWTAENGHKPMSKQRLRKEIMNHYCNVIVRDGYGGRELVGIGLSVSGTLYE